MKHIGLMLVMCVLMTGDLSAESVEYDNWRSNQSEREGPTVADWIKSILPSQSQSDTDADAAQPGESEPQAPAPQPATKRRRSAAKPDPEPKSEAEQKWWEEVANPVVFTFRDCLGRHAASEIQRGSQSSYPEFITEAMHGPCQGEFATMAQLILERHGEDDFAKIAKELIATTFMPAVKAAAASAPVAQNGQKDPAAALKAAMRRDKNAMFGCFTDEADRLAAASTAPADQLAEAVIRSCRARAQAYFDKLGKLYPGAAAGETDDNPTAILNTSYHPAIVRRIKHMRADTITSRQ